MKKLGLSGIKKRGRPKKEPLICPKCGQPAKEHYFVGEDLICNKPYEPNGELVPEEKKLIFDRIEAKIDELKLMVKAFRARESL
jgi:hypothetical protein